VTAAVRGGHGSWHPAAVTTALLRVAALLLILLLTASCGAVGPASPTPWSALRGTRGDSAFTVEYHAGVCGDRFSHVTVEEGPSEVVVTVHSRRESSGRVCPDVAEVRTADVLLREPLGDRTLVDGACRSPDRRDTPPCIRPDKADPRPL
jgi:hypothetical protein